MHRYFRWGPAAGWDRQLSEAGARERWSRSPAQRAMGPLVPMAACGARPLAHVRSRWGPAWARARQSCSAPAPPRSPWEALRRALLLPPPHARVCQAGHPVLRAAAAAVEPALLASPDVQRLIRRLVRVMRRLPCVGLSAPQLGAPLQLFVAELPERLHLATSPSLRAARQMAPFPLRVFVNPAMRVLDSRLVSFPEGCASIAGFAACVPRYQAVEVSGLNEAGDAVSWQASGWAARILQHEMDHLQGILYIDKMESRTFVNTRWTELND